ncbi:MAG: hypothetical protein JSV56_08450 [Methanomassiliicoccales archaeon]|nr:MAG: hypothetical protein JSV56_08450 [Methanomassiliicoccales archaeon]
MKEQLWHPEEEAFEDIYLYDPEVKKRIEILIESDECLQLIEKARSSGSVLPLLDEVLPDKKVKPLPKLLSKIRPFYNRAEYRTKEDYLQYLKQAYGFMETPLEVPPGRVIGLLYPKYKRTWTPSQESAQELLKSFYVEVKLISELTPMQWKDVAEATNPEVVINRLVFKTKFKPDFLHLLKTIPWIMSLDAYGSPGLDLIYRSAPGQELPKKPFGVGESYLAKLAKASLESRVYTVIWIDDEKVRLKNKAQIITQIESDSSARMDSFIGLSKIERDFVIHKHIIIWKNPGFNRYKMTSLFKRMIYYRPARYLCVIREEALPLEIPFLERKFKEP